MVTGLEYSPHLCLWLSALCETIPSLSPECKSRASGRMQHGSLQCDPEGSNSLSVISDPGQVSYPNNIQNYILLSQGTQEALNLIANLFLMLLYEGHVINFILQVRFWEDKSFLKEISGE